MNGHAEAPDHLKDDPINKQGVPNGTTRKTPMQARIPSRKKPCWQMRKGNLEIGPNHPTSGLVDIIR